MKLCKRRIKMSAIKFYFNYDDNKDKLFISMHGEFYSIMNSYSKMDDFLKKIGRIKYTQDEREKLKTIMLKLYTAEKIKLKIFPIWSSKKVEFKDYVKETIEGIQNNFNILTCFFYQLYEIMPNEKHLYFLNKSNKIQVKVTQRIERLKNLIVEFEQNEKNFNEYKMHRKEVNKGIKEKNRKQRINDIKNFKNKLLDDNKDFKVIFIVSSFILLIMLLITYATTGGEIYLIGSICCIFLPVFYEMKNEFLLVLLELLNIALAFGVYLPINLVLHIFINSWLSLIKNKSIQLPISLIPTKWLECKDASGWIKLALESLKILTALIFIGIGLLPMLLAEFKIISVSGTVETVFEFIAMFIAILGIGYIANSELKEFIKKDKENYRKAFNVILYVISFVSIIIAIISLKI